MAKVREAIVHHVSLQADAVHAPYRLIVVEVVTEDGLIGVGELGMAYGAGANGGLQAICDLARAYLVGHEAGDVAQFTERAYRNAFWLQGGGPLLHGAISALDQALWDIKGKQLGVPVYQLLGGAMRDRIRLYCNGWSRDIGGAEALGERAAQETAKGFTALKFDPFKYTADGSRTPLVGRIDPDLRRLGLERIRAVRRAVGPDVEILVELHGNLMPIDALWICGEMADQNPFFVEEPIDSSDAGILANFAQSINIPIAVGERIYTNAGFRPYLESGAVSVIQPDIGLCGGITEAMRIAASAQAHQVMVQPHNCGGPISTAACLQVDSVIPNMLFQEIFPHFDDDRQNLVHAPFEQQIKDGHLALPDLPGLGVELNRDYLGKHATSIRVTA